MKISILCFQTKKNLIEKTQKQKNGSPLKSGQNHKKSAKLHIFPPGGPPKVQRSIFDDFALISKCCRLPVSGSFLSIFFLFESREQKFSFFICGIAHISISDIVRTPLVTTLIFRLKLPFFLRFALTSTKCNFFLFFRDFYKIVSKLVKDDLSFR